MAKLLGFSLFREYGCDMKVIHIDPDAVASVIETECRPAFSGYSPVAIIRLIDGTEYKVYDESRCVAKHINEAKG